MLKIAFGLLLVINLGLMFFQVGWLDALLSPSGREPQRLKNQINADKLRLLSPPAGAAVTGPATLASPAAPAASFAATAAVPALAKADAPAAPKAEAKAGATASCVEFASFTIAEARRFETRLAELKWTPAPVRREARESSSHMVWIPPQPAGRESAERKAAELKRIGINDFVILQDNPALRNGISLGVFMKEEAAKARLAQLAQQGVKSAKMVEHKMPVTRVGFQFVALDDKGRGKLETIRQEFARVDEKPC